MSLQPHLIEFFENLPYLPLCEISKHLGPCDLIKLSFVFPIWKQQIISVSKNREWKEFISIDYESIGSNAELSISFDSDNVFKSKTNFKIHWRQNTKEKEKIEMSDNETLIVHSMDSKERQILEICIFWISNFKFYSNNWKTDDSTWMSRKELESFPFAGAKFGINNFTESDLNVSLIRWANGLNEKVFHWKISVSDGWNMEKVLEGLKVQKWNPKKRDRKFLLPPIDNISPIPLDMSEGFDIIPKHTKKPIGTVQIIDGTLHFCVWKFPFNTKQVEKKWVFVIKHSCKNGVVHLQSRENVENTLQSLRNLRGNPLLTLKEVLNEK